MAVNHYWPIEGRRALCGSTKHTPKLEDYYRQWTCLFCVWVSRFKIGGWWDKQAKKWRFR